MVLRVLWDRVFTYHFNQFSPPFRYSNNDVQFLKTNTKKEGVLYTFTVIIQIFSYVSQVDLVTQQFNQLGVGLFWIVKNSELFLNESIAIESGSKTGNYSNGFNY